jgi:alpha-galactosidase
MADQWISPVVVGRIMTKFAPWAAWMLLTAGAMAQTPVSTGTWMTVDHKLDNGQDYKVYFQLRQNGNELTGHVSYPWGTVQVKSGSVSGNKFKLVQHLWEGMEFQDEGELVAGQLKYRGTNFDHQWHDYTGVPVPASAAAPPARMPLPPLREVPYNGLAKTPPMGWNSWNKFGTRVTDALLRGIADAMVSSGMRDAGFLFVNIDDGWEGERDANGALHANQKFPDMKKLADYIHSKGLKFGIYSSPGANTCAGYEGSLGHEQQDANTFAAWGVDYLKYDVCGASKVYRDDEMRAVYQKMGEALLKTGRPIVFSLSADAYLWGRQAGGNLWRTTGDISDNWDRVSEIGFSQDKRASYAGPGHWNDPDMLEIGNGHMTEDEYRTHMSLWCILAAPLISGNDLRTMDENTKAILTNHEVIALDQDVLGKEGLPLSRNGNQEIWTKPLADGAVAVGLFNRGESASAMTVGLADLKLPSSSRARDLWAHQDIQPVNGQIKAMVPPHGVALFRIK